VSVFNKNTRRVLSYNVLRQQKPGVMTKGVVSGGGGGRRRECLARRSPPFVADLFFTVRDSYG